MPRCEPTAAAAGLTSKPFPGGDLEQHGTLQGFLDHRASPSRTLVFLSVADTRDHRRQYKDPALRTISIDFTLNLVSNLRQLGLDNFGILTTKSLCRTLQRQHCLHACAWTSLWHEHAGLATWGLRPGDMFLMWAQQWHYISRAVALGYSILRADADVYLAEDPFPILNGPLLAPFHLVVQQDFGGPLGGRPACQRVLLPRHDPTRSAIASCGTHHGTALLNIGLLFVRGLRSASEAQGVEANSAARGIARGDGRGALAMINGTWARFLEQLSRPRRSVGSGVTAQPQHVESLIDQEMMRRLVGELATSAPGKPSRRWTVVPGGAAQVYPPEASVATACALRERAACARVQAERSRTAFLAQTVAHPEALRRQQQSRTHQPFDRIALAPDWLFGRGCLLAVRSPLPLLASLQTTAPLEQTRCEMPPARGRQVQPAPGPAAGMLVATHFVYSMALKRKRTFRAFGWDAVPAGTNRTAYPQGDACWRRSQRGMLFSHTFMAQTESFRAVLCALPSGSGPECSCCVGLKSLEPASGPHASRMSSMMETTGGAPMRWNSQRAAKLAQGCTDYQLFWD